MGITIKVVPDFEPYHDGCFYLAEYSKKEHHTNTARWTWRSKKSNDTIVYEHTKSPGTNRDLHSWTLNHETANPLFTYDGERFPRRENFFQVNVSNKKSFWIELQKEETKIIDEA